MADQQSRQKKNGRQNRRISMKLWKHQNACWCVLKGQSTVRAGNGVGKILGGVLKAEQEGGKI